MVDGLTLMVIVSVLAGMAPKVKAALLDKFNRGDLEKVHEIDTFFKRLTQRELDAKTGRYKRRKLFKKSSTLPACVITFKGDKTASDGGDFARRADEVVENIERLGVVVVEIESLGGTVTGYGIIHHQMVRIRAACDRVGIKLIACVTGDGAASGGYMAALPAHMIFSPELSIIGSIGAAFEFLNFNGFLTEKKIQAVQVTAGPLKRTLTQVGPITPEATEHVHGQLKKVHEIFKGMVKKYRPGVDREKTCTGDYWQAVEALDLGLIDDASQHGFSDIPFCSYEEVLLHINKERDLVYIGSKPASKWLAMLAQVSGRAATSALSAVMTKVLERPAIRF